MPLLLRWMPLYHGEKCKSLRQPNHHNLRSNIDIRGFYHPTRFKVGKWIGEPQRIKSVDAFFEYRMSISVGYFRAIKGRVCRCLLRLTLRVLTHVQRVRFAQTLFLNQWIQSTSSTRHIWIQSNRNPILIEIPQHLSSGTFRSRTASCESIIQ